VKTGILSGQFNSFCFDDSMARAEAKRLVGHDIELWQGHRKVVTFAKRRITPS